MIRPLLAVLTAAALALLGLLATPQTAFAADFAITGPAADSLVTDRSATMTGTRAAGAAVRVTSSSQTAGNGPTCDAPAGGEQWSCELALPDGTWTVTATQTLAGTATTATVRLRSLGAPAFDGGTNPRTAGQITGGGLPGAGLRVVVNGVESSLPCSVTPSSLWACQLPVTASGTYAVTVTQLWPGTNEVGGSTARTVIVDRDAPAAPSITSPAAGQRLRPGPVAFSGSGEDGARVDVSLGGGVVCQAQVQGGSWLCTAQVAEGDWSVQSLQVDTVGNVSSPSSPVGFSVAAANVGQPPRNPIAPTDPIDPSPAATPTPTPSPSTTPVPTPVQGGIPFFPPPVGGDSGLPPGQTWGTPTQYGAAIAPIGTAAWWLGLLLAVAFLLLVAVPARLLAAVLRDRIPARERDPDEPPLLGPWTTAALALGGAVLLAALAGGIQWEVRYLRLAAAIGVALTLLNLLGVALAGRVGGRLVGVSTGLRLAPVFLGIGAIVAILSRISGAQPPLIIGVVVAVGTLAIGRSGAVIAGLELAAVTLLGVAAWIGHSALGAVVGFWGSLLSETLAALTLAALGSAVAMILPVGRMPGRAIWDWSRLAWVAASLPPAVLAGTLFGGSITFPLAWIAAAALAFAAVAVSVFAWTRLVRPRAVTH